MRGGAHSFEEWRASLASADWQGKRTGIREWAGPCPLCGGTDRFHFRPGSRGAAVLASCRGCDASFAELAAAVFGNSDHRKPKDPVWWKGRFLDPETPEERRIRNSGVGPAQVEPPITRITRTTRLWSGAKSIPRDPSHPARRWAARRNLWLECGIWPHAMRWHTGSIVAAFAPVAEWLEIETPEPTGVQCLHIDPDGAPRQDRGGLAKRSHGTMSGAVCVIGDPLKTSGVVHVTEGLADALAISARKPGAVLATGGTAGFKRLAAPIADLDAVVILWPDGDEPGRCAAVELARKLRELGAVCAIENPPNGEDPASMAGPDNTWRNT